MANPIVHFELMGPDGKQQKTFYESMFGWQLEAVPGFGDYFTVEKDAIGVGGAVGQGPEESPAYLTIYVEVADIDAHLARIEKAGGNTITPRTVIPGTVTFAMFADPAGNVVGLVEQDVADATG